MITTIQCAALQGIDAHPVQLEVDLSRQGLPVFTMVGLPEGAVRESKERVFAALKNSGFRIPPSRITVNLAPADVRKAGSHYDLPLAMGLIAAAGFIDPDKVRDLYFVGELSLSGEVKGVPGVLPVAVKAREERAAGLVAPADNAPEAAIAEGLPVYGVRTLTQVVRHVAGEELLEPVLPAEAEHDPAHPAFFLDFAEVKGQEFAKRAIEIAAAGGHNLLFLGPPGSGKTMLAQRVPTVLPPLSFDEALEATKIYSVAGLLNNGPASEGNGNQGHHGLLRDRPFRAPHHTISDAGLVGGGQHPRPGEVSLAHRGVLFLDELPEFKKQVLEVMRQPLENGHVTISRAATSLTFPADFMLVAAMNPCPCGYLGSETHPCGCTPTQVQRYRGRLSGPLLDRIDMHVEVPAVPYKDLQAVDTGTGSADMAERVRAARAVQTERYARDRKERGGNGSGPRAPALLTNSQLSGKWLERHCALDPESNTFLERAVNAMGLSARAYTRILRIARTIADLDHADRIAVPHLAEAVSYRALDKNVG